MDEVDKTREEATGKPEGFSPRRNKRWPQAQKPRGLSKPQKLSYTVSVPGSVLAMMGVMGAAALSSWDKLGRKEDEDS